MNKPSVGLCVFVNGIAVELLYETGQNREGQRWRVRKLFVDDSKEYELLIRPSDICSPLHTDHPCPHEAVSEKQCRPTRRLSQNSNFL